MPKFIPRDVDFIVCSGGGAGTTMLLDFFSIIRRVNSPKDYDNLKHMPIPPVSFNRKMKCIFIYSNPLDTCISLFNRHFQTWQSRKLLRHSDLLKRSDIDRISSNLSLDEYAENGQDLLGLENQFINYSEKYILYPTLFLKYENLWDNLNILQEFISLTHKEMESFPKKSERVSSLDKISSNTYNRLLNIYNPFIKRIKNFDEAHIALPSKKSGYFKILASKNCRLATVNGINNLLRHKNNVYGE